MSPAAARPRLPSHWHSPRPDFTHIAAWAASAERRRRHWLRARRRVGWAAATNGHRRYGNKAEIFMSCLARAKGYVRAKIQQPSSLASVRLQWQTGFTRLDLGPAGPLGKSRLHWHSPRLVRGLGLVHSPRQGSGQTQRFTRLPGSRSGFKFRLGVPQARLVRATGTANRVTSAWQT